MGAFVLTSENYYSQEANKEYLSVSQYKQFVGTYGRRGCEFTALEELNGRWQQKKNSGMMIGSYVDSYVEGTLDKFKQENPEIFKKDGTLKADFTKAEQVIARIERDPFFMSTLAGEKQVIMTGELFGAKWKIKIVTFKSGDKTALTENFTRSEFACPCGCNSQMIEQELADKIQGIRDKLGKKIRITSGYRCVSHNASKKVGGSKQSRHLYGIAADWRTEDRSVNPVCLGILAQKAGFGGIGIYWHSRGAFVHTDTRGGKATWLCTTPGQYPSTSYNAFILPTIKQACSGAANRSATIMLQKLLKVNADGIFGSGTTKALMLAQQKHGLVPDGICGPKSWTALSGASKYL